MQHHGPCRTLAQGARTHAPRLQSLGGQQMRLRLSKLAAREREEATAIVELYEAMNKKQAATTAVKEAREDAKKLRSDVNDK